MRPVIANILIAGIIAAMPLAAIGQNAMPVIPALPLAHRAPASSHVKVHVSAHAAAETAAPGVAPLATNTRSTNARVEMRSRNGLTAHAGVGATRWAPLVPVCVNGALPGADCSAYAAGVRRGEVGAGYAAHGVKLDLSMAQSRADDDNATRQAPALPRVLPAAGGAAVAAPLWFRNSTATSLSAKGEVQVAGDTRVDLGASVGHVQFLPGSGPLGGDTLDQTTVSLGIRHGAVSGALVGHVLEPNLPGAALSQRWSTVDLGISVRLPWRGELNFGAQNLWSSGKAPLLGPGNVAPDQGRVPYVQYHQDL